MPNATIQVFHSEEPATYRFKKPYALFGKAVGNLITTKLGGLAIVDTAERIPAVEIKHLGTLCGEQATDWVPLSYLEPMNTAADELAVRVRMVHRRSVKAKRVRQDQSNIENVKRELAETKHQVRDLEAGRRGRDETIAALENTLSKTREGMAQMRTDWAAERQFFVDEERDLHVQLKLAEERANVAHRRAQRAEGEYTRLAKRYKTLAERVMSAQASPRATLESALNLLDALSNALGHPAGMGRGPVSGPTFDALRAAIDESLGRWLSLAHFAQPLEPVTLGPKPRADRPIPYKVTAKFDTETQAWKLGKKSERDGVILLAGDFIGSEPRTFKMDLAEMSKRLGDLFKNNPPSFCPGPSTEDK
jgi:DNA-binding ferritin-like protein